MTVANYGDAHVMTNKMLPGRLQFAAVCLLLSGLFLARPCAAGGPPPVITVQPLSQTVPYLGTVAFSVSASSETTLTYQWRKNGAGIAGATSSSYTITNAQTGNEGSYSVKVYNGGGSVKSSNAILTVDVPPTIKTQPQSQAVVPGQNVSFSVVANGTAPFSYQWNFNGTAMAGDTTATLTLTDVQTNQAGSYTVVVTNSWGSVTSAVAALTDIFAPAITTQPQSQVVAHGQNVSFSVAAGGTAPFTYQWYFNGSTLGSGAQSSTLTLTDVHTHQAGNYTVVVANAAGSVTSVVATLAVYFSPGIQTQPQNLTVTQGQNASFSVVASGSAPFSYQWSFDGAAISGATNESLTLTNVQTAEAGSYTVVVTNPVGSVTSQVAMLTVDVPPSITTQPQSQWVMPGQNVSFSVVASGTGPFTYQWFFNGSTLGRGARSATFTVNNIGSNSLGSYTVVVNNNWGSATSAVATLAFMVPPEITTQPQSLTVIVGQNATFSAIATSTGPPSYQWSLDSTAVSDETNATLSITNAQTTDAGSYVLVVTNNAGSITSAVATLTVLVPPGIQTQPNNLTVTQGQIAAFSVVANGSAPFSYQWSLDGTAMSDETNATLSITNAQTTDAGSYTVVVTTPAGSVTSQVATLTVYIPPGITTQPQSLAVAQSQNASFSVVANGSAPFSYQWNFDGAAMPGDTNAMLTLTNVQTNQAGSYTVVVTNNAGSITSAVAILTVIVPPGIQTQPNSLTVTQGQNASFSVVANGSAPFSYKWNFDGAVMPGDTNAMLTLTNVQATQAGSYTVVVTNNAGSITSAVATLTVTIPVVTLSLPSAGGLTASGFTFQLSAPVGITYVVLASSDLQSWTPIATNVTTNGVVVFTDPAATNFGSQFYRAVVP